MVELAIHPWDFCFGGLAFVWLAVVAFALSRQSGEKTLWACLAWFALIHAADLWVQMAALGRPGQTAFQSVRVVLAMGAVAALFEFGRRSIRRLGGRAWGRSFYTPLIVVVAAGVLIVSWLHPSAFCVMAGLPAQIVGAVIAVLAASGLWQLGHRTPTGRSRLFRSWPTPVAAALLIAAAWAGTHWYSAQAGDGGRTVDVAAARSTIPSAGADVQVDVQAVEPEKQPALDRRESMAMRRLRSSWPLMLVTFGFVILLGTMWAAAQRNQR